MYYTESVQTSFSQVLEIIQHMCFQEIVEALEEVCICTLVAICHLSASVSCIALNFLDRIILCNVNSHWLFCVTQHTMMGGDTENVMQCDTSGMQRELHLDSWCQFR